MNPFSTHICETKFWFWIPEQLCKKISEENEAILHLRLLGPLNQSGDLLQSVCICFFYRSSSVNNFSKIHRHVASVEERNRKFNTPLPLMALLWGKIYKIDVFLKNHLLFSMCIKHTKWQYSFNKQGRLCQKCKFITPGAGFLCVKAWPYWACSSKCIIFSKSSLFLG